jgi:chorismate dehydratase
LLAGSRTPSFMAMQDHPTRLRLGHIRYSNCFPVHARLLEAPRDGDPRILHGIPSELNAALERGAVDVAPCSSIEFARHADRYGVLRDLVIGSQGPVRSILLVGREEPQALTGRLVALPTASATSVVLLKILLATRWNARPRFTWFDQARQDPFDEGADAALYIGDVALRPGLHPGMLRTDLGESWRAETGLPFAFAVWQTRLRADDRLRGLHGRLVESRDWAAERLSELAGRHAASFGFPPGELTSYWEGLTYHLDERMIEGLTAFYRLAADVGELERAPELRWIA